MGAEYPRWEYLMEDDTPSLLNLINNGLSDPEHPDWGGWGGRCELYTLRLQKWHLQRETRWLWADADSKGIVVPDRAKVPLRGLGGVSVGKAKDRPCPRWSHWCFTGAPRSEKRGPGLSTEPSPGPTLVHDRWRSEWFGERFGPVREECDLRR
jgi:hypothetical protein